MSTVMMVLIVVSSIAVVVTIVLGEPPQPATHKRRTRRVKVPRRERVVPAFEQYLPPRWPQRVRSAVALVLLAVVIGIVVAGCIGLVLVLVGYNLERSLD